MNPTHAIILSAGLGTRMRPLTETMPKPLIAVQGKPLIDWCLDWVQQASIAQVVVNTSYRAQQLEDYLALRRRAPRIHFSREEPVPLETGGGIAKALPLLGQQPFVSMNSDAIFPPQPLHPITRLQQAWDDTLDFVMLLVPRAQAIGWQGQGDFICDAAGRIRRPHAGEEAPYIFTGAQIMHPRVFAGCPSGAFSLSKFWNARIGADGWYERIRAVIHTGAWVNVGDLAGLAAAEDYLGGASIGSRI
jgi:MurNAc alpha-1-phosphate uridylyltransferase